jgi:hypothetical protein
MEQPAQKGEAAQKEVRSLRLHLEELDTRIAPDFLGGMAASGGHASVPPWAYYSAVTHTGGGGP